MIDFRLCLFSVFCVSFCFFVLPCASLCFFVFIVRVLREIAMIPGVCMSFLLTFCLRFCSGFVLWLCGRLRCSFIAGFVAGYRLPYSLRECFSIANPAHSAGLTADSDVGVRGQRTISFIPRTPSLRKQWIPAAFLLELFAYGESFPSAVPCADQFPKKIFYLCGCHAEIDSVLDLSKHRIKVRV